jgi:uncharacterized protein (TIGR00730 family)
VRADGDRASAAGSAGPRGTLGEQVRPVRSVCVFCGSNPGRSPIYLELAQDVGRTLAAAGVRLVYGGGRVGMMGALADAALAASGTVLGVIPRHLAEREVAHDGLDELHVVGSMHERKALMAELADAFVTLPGGFGTLEETFEILTWSQLGLHAKPLLVLDAGNFFAPLLAFLDHAVAEGFLRPEHRGILLVETDPARILARLGAFSPPRVEKWLAPGEE